MKGVQWVYAWHERGSAGRDSFHVRALVQGVMKEGIVALGVLRGKCLVRAG